MPVPEQLYIEVSRNSLQSSSRKIKLTFEGVDKKGLSCLLETLNSIGFELQRIACTNVLYETREGRFRDQEIVARHRMFDFA
jgi:hypothetical protein